jgi:hypothetical protein
MLRFNTTADSLEQYASTGWEAVGALVFTVIASETFDGDDSTVAFTLADAQTTASCIVSINGVVQLPTDAYSVSSTTLTFTEAPATGDKIEVRKITTTQTVTNLESSGGEASVTAQESGEVDVKGNLMPSADSTYSIGNSTVRWSDIYVDAGSVHLGSIVLKESGGELAIFAADGTTPADITSGSLGAVSADAITNGTTNVTAANNADVVVTVAGSTAATFASTGLTVAGNLTVSGTTTTVNSATLNVADKNITVANGAADSAAADGAGLTVDGASATFTYSHTGTKWNMNKTLSVTGAIDASTTITATGNVTGGNLVTGAQVVATGNVTGGNLITGAQVVATGNVTGGNLITGAQVVATGNVTGGNLITGAQVVATGNVTGGNLITAGLVSAISITKTGTDGVGNIGQSNNKFNTIFGLASSAQYADLAEKYEADAEYEPGTVVHFGGEKEVSQCDIDHCTRVAGVVSTDPAYRMNDTLEAEHVAMVALTGRVPCKVTGPVAKGDMMVSAGNGMARAEANPTYGAVIGKALENWEGGEGVIEVVIK